MIDIIYKTAKPSHLKKLQILQNINNLMFQVIFIFFLFNSDKSNHIFFHTFLRFEETYFLKMLTEGMSIFPLPRGVMIRTWGWVSSKKGA